MPFFTAPEIAALVGTLDDDALASDNAAGAAVLRELIRSANGLTVRGDELFRYLARAGGTDGEAVDSGGLEFASPFWAVAIPVQDWPVDKKAGIVAARMRIRSTITSGAVVEFQLASRGRPFRDNPAVGDVLVATGTGSRAVDTKNDLVVQAASDEVLTLYQRARITGSESLLATGTYGGKSSGTVTSHQNDLFMDTVGAAWNTTGQQVHSGGHYVHFYDPLMSQILFGPCKIEEVYRASSSNGLGLYFSPPREGIGPLVGMRYEIRKLPDLRISSVAIYGVDRTL